MKSVKAIYKIGKGPSSSHTMGPFKCVSNYIENHPEATELYVTLYGSLAATGKGHLTDRAVLDACGTRMCTIGWEPKENLPVHPNGIIVAMVDANGEHVDPWTYYSVGGGDIICIEHPIVEEDTDEVYVMTTMKDILDWCNANGRSFWEFVDEHE